ncbi:MAG: prolipoprotein diacylglyceryl transferase family protein [Verrucomicrobiota bacterium]
MSLPEPSAYGWITLVALVLGAWMWHRRWKTTNPALFGIFIGGIAGAFVGAKMVYILAEGWLHLGADDFWLQIVVGKTILGALLGGYGGVEFTKKLIDYREPTGDWFAFVVPMGIATGRLGCMRYGCCLGNACDPDAWFAMVDDSGVARWPAAGVELIFNLTALFVLFQLRKFPSLKGQLFHLYLISYGTFRFAHEFVRGTPKIIGDVMSGYQVAALAVVALGVWRFWDRKTAVSL